MTQTEFEARVMDKRKKLTMAARRILRSDDCEDAVQSAVLSAWSNIHQLKDPSRFDAWLMQILRNHCYQLLRDQAKQRAAADALARQYSSTAASTGLYDSLETLDENDRKLLLMHHAHGYTIDEMSKQLGVSADVLKMRLYRARKRLKIALITLLLLILMACVAIGSRLFNVDWFLSSRNVISQSSPDPNFRSVFDYSYNGRFLQFEATDLYWDSESSELLFTYALSSRTDDYLLIYNGNLGVDGKRHDHIWTEEGILPLKEWADGTPVYTYALGGWRLGNQYLHGSEDFITDGKCDAFFARLSLDSIHPNDFEALSSDDGFIHLECDTLVYDYETGDPVESGFLSIQIKTPASTNAEEERL